MVLVSPLLNPTASWEFEGEILVLHHPTTISTRYQAMGKKTNQQVVRVWGLMRIWFQLIAVHCGSLRQTAQIQSMSQECLRTGDKALVHFRFIKHPEYIKPGLRLVISITDLIVFNRVKCLLCWFN
jgi:GTPase